MDPRKQQLKQLHDFIDLSVSSSPNIQEEISGSMPTNCSNLRSQESFNTFEQELRNLATNPETADTQLLNTWKGQRLFFRTKSDTVEIFSNDK